MSKNTKWQLWLLWLTAAFGSLSSLSVAQSPMDTIGAGMITAISSMADIISNGAAARKEHGISSEFFSAHSKSEMGIGKAMAGKRRRRHANQLLGEEDLLLPVYNAAHPHQHRGKRSPCHTFGLGGTGGTGGGQIPNPNPIGDGTDYSDVVERKRRQRKRNATQRKKAKSTSKKTKRKLVSRRRRQATPEGDFFDVTGKKIAQTAKKFADTVQSVMSSMISMAKSIHTDVKETFSEPKKN